MILLEKNNQWKDETNSIESCELRNGFYFIQFKNASKPYQYQTQRVFDGIIRKTESFTDDEIIIWEEKPYPLTTLLYLQERNSFTSKIVFSEDYKLHLLSSNQVRIEGVSCRISSLEKKIVRRSDGFIYQNINEILVYPNFYLLRFRNNSCRYYPKSALEISTLFDQVGPFEYFKEVAKATISSTDKITEFLYRQYNDMKIDDTTVLYNYLKSPTIIKRDFDGTLLFPFDFNPSQIAATKCAFSNNISVIEGPPGTGKTETILNILVNLFMQHKTVAVVSGNNYAVENIKKKLKKQQLDFLVALLGNTDNREDFFKAPPPIPDLSSYALTPEEILSFKQEVHSKTEEIISLLELSNKLATKRIELSDLENEFFYFEDSLKDSHVEMMDFSNLKRKQLSNLLVETYLLPVDKKISFLRKLKLLFGYRFVYFKELAAQPDKIQLNLQRYLYLKKLQELKQEINDICHHLDAKNFDTIKNDIKEKSMRLFKAELYEHYSHIKDKEFDNVYRSKQYYLDNFLDFIKKHPVILSTVHSLRSCSGENFLYDYVIIDESSQTDLVAAGVALSCAKNVVIVGDLKQLSHIVSPVTKKKVQALPKLYSIASAYDYVTYNILSSVKELYKDLPSTLLREHYRCPPKIIGFCNQYFYDNQLIIHTSGSTKDTPLLLIRSNGFHTSREDEDGKLSNLRELDELKEYEELINKEHFSKNNIGFIAPFNAQVNLAEEELEKDIFKSTINKFQGQDSNIIVFSTVLDDSSRTTKKRLEFVNNSSLVNVAVSRATTRFVLVSNVNSFKPGSTIKELINYMEYNSLSDAIIKSNVYSIFELMYPEFSDKLLSICIHNIKKISTFPSEDLANYVIEDVLTDPNYSSFKYVFSLNLKKIIKNPSLLTPEEYRFVYETRSEVDFVIYNKNSHMPVLLIEVDGYAFHHKEKDKKRDALKNKILDKYGIRYLRWATNGRGERESLISMLNILLLAHQDGSEKREDFYEIEEKDTLKN